jgi:hypothetical protein
MNTTNKGILTGTRLGRLSVLLLGCGMLLTGAFMLRGKHVEARVVRPQVEADEAGRIYHERMQETDRLLRSEGLDLSWDR